jgi:predicted CxxxxCH...CXXCH cytochrome family protein
MSDRATCSALFCFSQGYFSSPVGIAAEWP